MTRSESRAAALRRFKREHKDIEGSVTYDVMLRTYGDKWPSYGLRVIGSSNYCPRRGDKQFYGDKVFRGPNAKKLLAAAMKRWNARYTAWRKSKGYDKNFNLRHNFLLVTSSGPFHQ